MTSADEREFGDGRTEAPPRPTRVRRILLGGRGPGAIALRLLVVVVVASLTWALVEHVTRSSIPSQISAGVVAEHRAVKDANRLQADISAGDMVVLGKSLKDLTNASDVLTSSETSPNAQYDGYARTLVKDYRKYYIDVVTFVFSPSDSLYPVLNEDVARCNHVNQEITALVKSLGNRG